jgi:ribosomal protein L4
MYKIYKPNSVILRKYISEFTILKRENFQPIKYFALPHTKSTLSFFSQANIAYNNLSLVIDRKLNKRPLILALGKYTTPLFLNYKDFVDEIAINFTPNRH